MTKGKAILVTGISGAGKTHYSRRLGCPVISYDDNHNYPTNKTDYEAIKQSVDIYHHEPVIAFDAWGIFDDRDLSILKSILPDSDIEVRYLYLKPLENHIEQLKKSNASNGYSLRQQKVTQNVPIIKQLMHIFSNTMNHLAKSKVQISWLFRDGTALTSFESDTHLKELANSDPIEELLSYIDKYSGDPKYQTIELQGTVIRKGYMQAENIWDEILQLAIDWKGRTVADLGCFNGYFSFKAEQAGATTVTGYNRHEASNMIASRLGLLNLSSCRFTTIADLSSLSPAPSDILLLLNSLHHITTDQPTEILRRILPTCKEAVLLVNPEQVPNKDAISGYTIVQAIDSHLKTDRGQQQLVHYKRQ